MIKAENDMLELPSNWVWTNLGDISKDVQKISPRDNPDKEFKYIDIASIDNKKQKIISHKRYLGKDAPSRARQLIKTGDILFSTVRTYLKNIATVDEVYNGQIASTGFCVIRPNELISSKLLFYYSQTDPFLNSLNPKQRGTSYPAVRNSDVFSQPFPLAPFPEQHRIVARIEELFSHLDAGVQALQKAKAQIQRYRQALLKAAVEGRLTEGWRKAHPEVEPAEKLLEQIFEEGKIKRKHEALPSTNFENLPKLPNSWGWIKSDFIFSFVTSGSRGWAKYYSDTGAIFLRMGNLNHDSISLDLRNVQRVRPPASAEGIRTRVIPEDILISITADVGMIGLVTEDLGEAYINQHVCLARPISKINSAYIAWYLSSKEGGQKQFLKLQRGATKAGLGLDDIRSVYVPFPPLLEQSIIVAEIKRNLSAIDEMHAYIERGIGQSIRFRQSILKRAFEGKLVPQNPGDEPASVLLRRICAERAREAPVRRGSSRGKRARDVKQSHLS